MYSEQPVELLGSVSDLEQLKGLAEAAMLLKCSKVFELTEKALIKNDLVDVNNVISCAIWGHDTGLRRFNFYCSKLIAESGGKVKGVNSCNGQGLGMALYVCLQRLDRASSGASGTTSAKSYAAGVEWGTSFPEKTIG